MQRSTAAEAAGIPRWLQVVDPGIGFANDIDGNLSLLNGVDTLRQSCENLPFLFGPSRKGFIGKSDPEEKDHGTIAACLASIQNNNYGENNIEACNMLRVHNVKAVNRNEGTGVDLRPFFAKNDVRVDMEFHISKCT